MKVATMRSIVLMILLQASAATSKPAAQPACPSVPATAVIDRLSDLPPDIRDNLISVYKDMGERNSPLLQTDARTEAERAYSTSRFFQAVLVKNEWFVQYELTFGGRRTLGYFRGSDGRFQRSPNHYFGGPFCETLEAAAHGVVTPGGLNF